LSAAPRVWKQGLFIKLDAGIEVGGGLESVYVSYMFNWLTLIAFICYKAYS